MSVLHIHQAVREAYPEVRVAAVVTRGLVGAGYWAESSRLLDALEAEVAAGTWNAPDEADERIAAWHGVYRRFGTNPRRLRPSVDALCRRLTRTGRLPRINGPVDAYNAVSVRHGLPAGAFDLDRVDGDVTVRIAAGADVFTPLGEPEAVELPCAPEVVYADETSVLTRHWNHRDADRTKVTTETKTAVFLLECALGDRGTAMLDDAAAELAALLAAHADRVGVTVLGDDRAATVELSA